MNRSAICPMASLKPAAAMPCHLKTTKGGYLSHLRPIAFILIKSQTAQKPNFETE